MWWQNLNRRFRPDLALAVYVQTSIMPATCRCLLLPLLRRQKSNAMPLRNRLRRGGGVVGHRLAPRGCHEVEQQNGAEGDVRLPGRRSCSCRARHQKSCRISSGQPGRGELGRADPALARSMLLSHAHQVSRSNDLISGIDYGFPGVFSISSLCWAITVPTRVAV